MTKLFANSGDPDQMPHSVVSDLGLHCLPIRHLPSYVSPNYNGLISAYRIIRFCKIQVYLSLISLYSFLRLSRSLYLFVCVDVLRPSQPNGVMSSAVSLPNHTFTRQA